MFNTEKFANDVRDTMTKARVKVKQSLLQQLLSNGDISAEAYSKEVSKLLEELLFDPASAVEKSQDSNTITVNGFDVPKPMSEKPNYSDEYFVVNTYKDEMFSAIEWVNDHVDNRCFSRNICHSTREAAVAHAKAMLGIDPWGDE